VSALVIDTSSWISYLAGRAPALMDEALDEGRVYLPPLVAAEILSGKLSPSERAELESLLSDLPLCGLERQHWFRVGTLRSALRAKGLSVSTPDAHIAQCALDLRAELLTEDLVFRRIAKFEALTVVEP